MSEVHITTVEAANQLSAKFADKNKQIEELFDKILSETDSLLNESLSVQQRFEVIVSIEYLLVKVRLETEFESLKVKSILADASTPASLRSIFMKRDQYLANIVVKLNNIRDDISTIQKVMYTKSSFNFK